MNNTDYIFDLTNIGYSYKGVLFAEVDRAETDKNIGCLCPALEEHYTVGIMAIIWTDERGIWHTKLRLKFPSGNKQVISKIYEKEFNEGIKVNETYVLQNLYKLPMVNKKWLPNATGTPDGILKLIQGADMIESSWVIEK